MSSRLLVSLRMSLRAEALLDCWCWRGVRRPHCNPAPAPTIRSSTVPSTAKRWTKVLRSWPMRCTRPMAWSSSARSSSGSAKRTCSASHRLRPLPPLLTGRSRTLSSAPVLKALSRFAICCEPLMRWYLCGGRVGVGWGRVRTVSERVGCDNEENSRENMKR